MKPVTHKGDFFSVVVMKDGSEVRSIARKIKGSALVVETFGDAPAGAKVVKSVFNKTRKADFKILEIPVAAIEGLKGRK